jgi:CRP/FNR family transcriptional regulator, anaerobic regulatory protein
MTHQVEPDPGCVAIACQHCGLYQLSLPMGLDSADTTLLDYYVKRKMMLKRGQVLFRAGEEFTSVYAIRSGSVKTFVSTGDGRLQITGFHVPGELLGLSAIGENLYNCEAVALEATSVCKISRECFEELAKQIPSVHNEMLKIMGKEIKHHQDLMLLLGKMNAEERLATYLLSLSRRLAMRNYSPNQFNLSMSRGDIGSYLGIAEETVCRIFTRFQDDGLIATERRNIILRDFERLSAIAHEPFSAISGAIPQPSAAS